jgi:glycine amidinotransferase
MELTVQSYTSWQPLEEVIVGRVYSKKHFSSIPDRRVRKQLQRIMEETEEDLDNLARVIQRFGARVRRPEPTGVLSFQDMLSRGMRPPTPPITPRDTQITLGERLLRFNDDYEYNGIITEYQRLQPGSVLQARDAVMAGAVASCIVRVGTDVLFDNSEYMTSQQMEWIQQHALDSRFRVRRCQTNGHGDAVFAILRPGVILSSKHDADINYRDTFPGWEVCRVPLSNIEASLAVGQFKESSFNGRWWVEGSHDDPAFAAYVDQYLSHWTGFVSETVFDVNCLVLDEHHVIFSSYNKEVFEFCQRHRIEPIIAPLRHRYFWDGGISCVTQDIRRRGPLETYL